VAKNWFLAISYADSGEYAYGGLASKNQVLLTMSE
jgi:hypothetical protein